MTTPEQILEDNGYYIKDLQEEGTLLFRNPDYHTSIIGMSDDYRVIYDYYKMVEYLIEYENMTEEDAVDFVEYDTIRSLNYMNGKKPIILMSFMI